VFFLGAFSSYPLNLLRQTLPQEDAASIWATAIHFQKELMLRNLLNL
jgi:hypothetical protein